MTGLVRDLEKAVDLALIQTYTGSKLGETLVCLVSGLIDYIDVKVVGLLVKQSGREGPELGSIGSQDCNGGFVDQG